MVSVFIAFVVLLMFLLDQTLIGIIGIGVFGLWFIFYQVADFQYIEFSDERGLVTLRYYKVITFGNTAFNSIEFPQHLLKNAWFENSLFGKKTDLTLFIKTKKGIAEYPSVSLTALKKNERLEIESSLRRILMTGK